MTDSKRARRALSIAAGVAVAVTATLAGAKAQAQETVDSCRATVGYKVNPGGGAWGAVDANSDAFLSRRSLASCEVKVVGTSVKGKPATTTEILPGPMTSDECSMYNSLSSVDSKLNQAKLSEAHSVITAMLAKVDDLYATGKLTQAGQQAIGSAGRTVRTCISTLMSQ